LALAQALDLDLGSTSEKTTVPELKQALESLRKQLPYPQNTQSAFQLWWKKRGYEWTEQLRAMMIQYRNIGHDWQFSEAQAKLLEQYYTANKLLVDCLNSDCYVTRAVREDIEATLLLPLSLLPTSTQT
jgi:predicted NACHT family NTPase